MASCNRLLNRAPPSFLQATGDGVGLQRSELSGVAEHPWARGASQNDALLTEYSMSLVV